MHQSNKKIYRPISCLRCVPTNTGSLVCPQLLSSAHLAGTYLDVLGRTWTYALGKKKIHPGSRADGRCTRHVNLKAKHLWAAAEGLLFTLIRTVRDLTVQWPPARGTEVNHTNEEKIPYFKRENPRLCFCS